MVRGKNLAVLISVLAARMALLGITLAHPEGGVLIDSRSYLEMADEVRRFGPFGDPVASDLHWTPGYPLFIAVVQNLTGTEFLGVVVAQLFGTAITCLLLVRIGTLLGAPQAGMIGAYVYALSPNAAMWSLTIMSESLFALLLTLALWTWLRSRAEGRIGWVAATGGLLGLASLVRPIGLPLIGIWAATDLWGSWGAGNRRRGVARLVAMVGGLALILAPWVVRNWVTYGEAVFSRAPWNTLVRFNLAYVLAEVEEIDRNEAAIQLEGQVNSWADVWAFIRAHPTEFLEQQGRGIFRSSMGVESGAWARVVGLDLESQGSFGILTAVLRGRLSEAWRSAADLLRSGSGTVLLIGVLAVFHTLASYVAAGRVMFPGEASRTELGVVVACLLLTAMYLLIAPGAAGQARFRVAAEPYLALLAGMGAIGWREALGRRRARKAAEAAANLA